MNAEKLAQMANQIASFFRAYPEEEACAGIRDHIASFWTERMREALLADPWELGLDPLVLRALCFSHVAQSPILKETSGPEAGGQLASDAG